MQPSLILPEDTYWATVQHFLSPSGGLSSELSHSQRHLQNIPFHNAELAQSSRVDQDVQEALEHHGVQAHHEANGVPDLKESGLLFFSSHQIIKQMKIQCVK
jgi:hypothetical protein